METLSDKLLQWLSIPETLNKLVKQSKENAATLKEIKEMVEAMYGYGWKYK